MAGYQVVNRSRSVLFGVQSWLEHPVDPGVVLAKHIVPLIRSGLQVQQVVQAAGTVTITTTLIRIEPRRRDGG
jgi:hypothetical protein